jgi:hypothetical protein
MHAHSPAQFRSPGAEPRRHLIERAGLPSFPALPRELDGVRTTPNGVARAIEDLKRSGYRPLHFVPGRAGALVDPAPRRNG